MDSIATAPRSERAATDRSGERQRCPLCGTELTALPMVSGHDRVFATGGEFGVHECRACGLGVTLPRLDGEALAQHYLPAYAPWQELRSGPLSRIKRARVAAAAHLDPYGEFLRSPPGRLLDVGCARGDLAACFARRGWIACGMDTSEAAVAAARAAGVDARIGGIEDAPWPAATFDLVVMSHVLEHVQDPADSLRRARSLLRPGGTLVVAVPDWDSWQRRRFGSHWVHLDLPRHLQHFTAHSLGDAVGVAGFARARARRNVSAVALPASVQFALFGRWVARGAGRDAFMAACMLAYPLTWLIGRALGGGDSLYLVAETPR